MTLDELITRLQDMRRDHGGAHEVWLRGDPDYNQCRAGRIVFQDNSGKGYWFRDDRQHVNPVFREIASFVYITW